jgi:hypothetical protein
MFDLLNLYLITGDDVEGIDTYQSAVVVAESKDDAILIFPGNAGEIKHFWCQESRDWYFVRNDGTRAYGDGGTWTHPVRVSVTLIGHLAQMAPYKAGDVVSASFYGV